MSIQKHDLSCGIYRVRDGDFGAAPHECTCGAIYRGEEYKWEGSGFSGQSYEDQHRYDRPNAPTSDFKPVPSNDFKADRDRGYVPNDPFAPKKQA